MNSRFNLLTRGIILVAAPLTMQLIFAAILMFTLSKIREQAVHEAYMRDMLAQTYAVCIGVPEIATLLLLQRQTMGLVSEEAVSKRFNMIDRRIQNLERFARNNPQQSSNVQKLETGRKHLEHALHDLPALETMESSQSYKDEMLQQTSALFNVLSDMVQTEKTELATAPRKSNALRQILVICIIGWIVLSIGVALLLTRYYARSIRDPLLHLAENARLLSQRKQLQSELKGTDAIALFDKTLHEVEAKLNAARENERLLVDNAADLICTLSPEYEFTSVNSFALRLLGSEPQALQQQVAPAYVIESEKEKFAKEMLRARNEMQVQFDLTLKKADGSVVETLWSSLWSPMQNSYFCVVHDVTEHNRIEAIKQGFISMISHDLRAPLNAILERMHNICNDETCALATTTRSEIESIENNLQWLLNMVNDLLDFERMQSGKMQFTYKRITLKEILNDAISLIKELAEVKSLRLVVEQSDELVLVDRSRFTQLVVNLLANAIKFSPEGGKIEVAIKRSKQRLIELSISDEGPGIPETFREKIFAPFEQVPHQTKTWQEGTGLGLAICKSIAEGHNARIYVRSVEPRGSAFCVELPALESPT